MRGEIRPVWNALWPDVWEPLSRHKQLPVDFFSELYRSASETLFVEVDEDAVVEASSDPAIAKRLFRKLKTEQLKDEEAVVRFLENTHGIIVDSIEDSDLFLNKYFSLIEAFLVKYSLRYELRRPFVLHTTLPGMFASMMKDLKAYTDKDAHLHDSMNDFEDSVRDLKNGMTETRIKTCIQKQFNMMEAIAKAYPGVTKDELSAICGQLHEWPHKSLKTAMLSLYGFGCDYPGIRHAGTPGNVIRPMETKDLVALTLILASFTPYFTQQIDYNNTYKGI